MLFQFKFELHVKVGSVYDKCTSLYALLINNYVCITYKR